MTARVEVRQDHFPTWVLERYPALADFAARVGRTSLLRIPGPHRIYAKCEWENPCGTIKDRVALAMIWDALANGLDPERDEILEYSGGQLAIALGRLCELLGIGAHIVLSEATAESLIETVRGCGATVYLAPKAAGFWGVMERAKAIKAARPEIVFLYQHRNGSNLAIHATQTASELIDQLGGRSPDAWVAAIGTGGTLVGVGSALHRANARVRLYGVTPAELPYGSKLSPNSLPKLAGSGGLGCGRRQPFVQQHEKLVTEHFCVAYDDAKAEMSRFQEETGVKVGSSAAANLIVARRVAERLDVGSVVATAFPSAGALEEWRSIEEARA